MAFFDTRPEKEIIIRSNPKEYNPLVTLAVAVEGDMLSVAWLAKPGRIFGRQYEPLPTSENPLIISINPPKEEE